MPKPSELPVWTTTLANRVKPLAGALASGFLYGQRPPPKWVNWLIGISADWIAWFEESSEILVPSVTSITTVGATVWEPPDGLVFADMVLIGGGQCGTTGSAGAGGKGGDSGHPVKASFPAALITGDLTVTIGNGGTTSAQRGVPSHIALAGSTLLWAPGGGTWDAGTWPSDVVSNDVLTAYANLKSPGGVGGSPGAGSRGHHSGFGPGGAGGSSSSRGVTGRGYGAGGGGGINTSGSAAGGGGGAGGYGLTQPDGTGGGPISTGAPGARGACFITAWRNPNLI